MKKERLIEIRKQKKVTLLELAKIMGVSADYLAKAELGEVKLTAEQIETIQAFLEKRL